MEFRIADTFTDSLARLTGEEQKAVKTTAFDLQMNPANPGMQFHKLDKAKDKRFWSVRVNRGIRLIVHRTDSSLLLCYVGHHDDAYRWAERRKLEVHPKTGAAQFVVVRETVVEIAVRKAVEAITQKPLLFQGLSDEQLLSYGVPVEWIPDVKAADEDTLLDVAAYLPGEAAEQLLQIATAGTSRPAFSRREVVDISPTVSDDSFSVGFMLTDDTELELDRSAQSDSRGSESSAFNHPDAQRRFRLMENREELERALDFPWEKWTTFLHPAQRDVVERDFAGPARVSGSAGTGKTIVALHRAVHLARKNPEARVLLATFSDTLAHALRTKLRRLIGHEPRLGERIDVHSLDAVGLRLYKSLIGHVKIVEASELSELLRIASDEAGPHKFNQRFLVSEWNDVVDSWQLTTWESYRDVARIGRKTRLSESQRRLLWSIFARVNTELSSRGLSTMHGVFTALSKKLRESTNPPYDFAVIDECQDLTIAQLRFLAALGAGRPSSLFFAGDLGQRIFQQPFSWKSLGIDIRGRSRTLRVNYRTSHQIRIHADRLLEDEIVDIDGNLERRAETVSVFNGPDPIIARFSTPEQEIEAVSSWLKEQVAKGVQPHELAIFVRSDKELTRGESAARAAGLQFKVLDEHVETTSGSLSICTMHLAKGLEFKAVAVMACDDEVIPSQERIEGVGDEADLADVYATERQLLYVACTRARDQLLVTGIEPISEFLDDLTERRHG